MLCYDCAVRPEEYESTGDAPIVKRSPRTYARTHKEHKYGPKTLCKTEAVPPDTHEQDGDVCNSGDCDPTKVNTEACSKTPRQPMKHDV